MTQPLGCENPVTFVDPLNELGEGDPELLSDQQDVDNEDTANPLEGPTRNPKRDPERHERLAALTEIPEDEHAFGQFITDLTPTLRGIMVRFGINPNDYDDYLNEIYLRLWLKRSLYANDRGQVINWACAVGRRYLIDRMRTNGRAPRIENIDDLHGATSFNRATPPIDVERQALTTIALHRALTAIRGGSIPRQSLGVLLLSAAGDIPQAEIAAQLGLTEAAVKLRIHRARKYLREALSEEVSDLA